MTCSSGIPSASEASWDTFLAGVMGEAGTWPQPDSESRSAVLENLIRPNINVCRRASFYNGRNARPVLRHRLIPLFKRDIRGRTGEEILRGGQGKMLLVAVGSGEGAELLGG